MGLNYSLTWSLTCFIILTLGYTIIKASLNPAIHLGTERAEDNPKVKTNNKGVVVLLMYMLITLIAQIVSNFSNAKSICQGSGQPFLQIFLYTLIPYFFIFGSIVLLINIKKGWLNPFSNTIGYLISMKLLKGNSSFNIIARYFKDKGGDRQKGLIEELCKDKSLVTNELSEDNYPTAMAELFPDINTDLTDDTGAAPGESSQSEDGDTKEDNDGQDDGAENGLKAAYKNLFKMVLLKDVIAEGVWFLLAGCLAITVETNIITAIECDYDPATMKAIKTKAEETHKASKVKAITQTKHT